MFNISVESVKSLKPVVTDNGIQQDIKATVKFEVPLSQAGELNGRECVIMTKEEHENLKSPTDHTLEELFNGLDKVNNIVLAMSAIIKEMTPEKHRNIGLSHTESV